MKKLLPTIILAVLFAACGGRISVTSLTVEMLDGSQPIATSEPRFSWQYESTADNVMQKKYRIVVASTEENARKGVGDMWDSKEVESSQMLYIPYQGKTLNSRDRCWWKVYATVTYGDKGREKE